MDSIQNVDGPLRANSIRYHEQQRAQEVEILSKKNQDLTCSLFLTFVYIGFLYYCIYTSEGVTCGLSPLMTTKELLYINIWITIFETVFDVLLFVMAMYKIIKATSMSTPKNIIFPFKLVWYAFIIYKFFGRSNNCRDTAKMLWYGHLLITVEAIIMFASVAMLIFLA